jgi:hypothetical protein
VFGGVAEDGLDQHHATLAIDFGPRGDLRHDDRGIEPEHAHRVRGERALARESIEEFRARLRVREPLGGKGYDT